VTYEEDGYGRYSSCVISRRGARRYARWQRNGAGIGKWKLGRPQTPLIPPLTGLVLPLVGSPLPREAKWLLGHLRDRPSAHVSKMKS
jgi:hypothetical protein